jgi:hypothetical protein
MLRPCLLRLTPPTDAPFLSIYFFVAVVFYDDLVRDHPYLFHHGAGKYV